MTPIRALQMRSPVVSGGSFAGMASLFAAAEKGAYYDFTDGTKLAVNSDGTGGPPSIGSACKWAVDLSPNLNHLRTNQTTGLPLRRVNGLETSGTNYGLFNTSGFGNWPNIVEPFEIICTLEQIAYAGTDKIMLAFDGSLSPGLVQGASSGQVRFYSGGYAPDMAMPLATEATVEYFSSSTVREQRLNNGSPVTAGTGASSITSVYLGTGSGGGTSGTQTRFKRMLIIGRVLTSVERAGAYAWASA